MAHAAARTAEPIREGVVAGLGPFIDTIMICTMSALVILMSGVWSRPAVGTVTELVGDVAIVQCGADIPESFQPLYMARIDDGKTLAIHTRRGNSDLLETVSARIQMPDGAPDAWTSLQTIRLSLADLDDEERGSVAVGQVVHLDIDGAEMTSFAFDTAIRGFGKYMVTLGVCLFAFSTMISWSYYGEKGAEYLLGARAILPYKFVFVVFVFIGMSQEKFQTVYDFSDATTGMMVLCNLPAVLILSPHVMRAAKSYFRRLDAGEIPRTT